MLMLHYLPKMQVLLMDFSNQMFHSYSQNLVTISKKEKAANWLIYMQNPKVTSIVYMTFIKCICCLIYELIVRC